MIDVLLFEREFINNLEKNKKEQYFLLSDINKTFNYELSKLTLLNNDNYEKYKLIPDTSTNDYKEDIIENFDVNKEIRKATDKISNEANKLKDDASRGMRSVADGIKKGAKKEFDKIKDGFSKEINNLKSTVEKEAQKAVDSLKKEADKATNEIKKNIDAIINEFKKQAESIEREAKKKVDSVTNSIKREVDKVIKNIHKVIEDALRNLKDLIKEIFNEIKKKILEIFNKFKEKIEDIVQTIKKEIEKFGDKVKQQFQKIIDGLERFKDNVEREIKEFIDLIVSTAKKVIDEIEEKISEIKDWIIQAVEKAKEISESIYKFTTGVLADFFRLIKEGPKKFFCKKYEENLGYDCRTFEVFLICTFIFIIMENTPIGKIPCMFGEIIVVENFCFYLWLFISGLVYYHKVYKLGTKKISTRPIHDKIINDILCPKIKKFTFIDCSIWLTALYIIIMYRLYERIPLQEFICDFLSEKIFSGACTIILIIVTLFIIVKRHILRS